MPDKLAFVTCSVPASEAYPPCSLCHARLASFEYTLTSDEPSFQRINGHCCLVCASSLLGGLEEVERARDSRLNAGGQAPPKTSRD